MAEKKLVIIDVDAMLGIRNTLCPPCCLRDVCNKNPNFLGENKQCLRREWCESAAYNPNDILEYRSASNITAENCYMAVIPALEKLAELNCLVSFWTTRPKRQTFRIIQTLKEVGIWSKAKLLSGTPLLLNNSVLPDNGNFSPATEKLTLFERVYGKLSNEGWLLAAIEADPLEASILRAYTGSQISIHLAPRIWLEILVMEIFAKKDGEEESSSSFWSGSKATGVVTVDRAS